MVKQMENANTDKVQLTSELTELRQKVVELQKAANEGPQTAEKLMRSEENHRRLFEQNIDGIVVVVDGRIVRVNQALCDLYGQPAEELAGKSPLEMIHPDHRKTAEQRMKMLLRSESLPTSFLYKALRSNGSELWVEVRSRAFTWEGKAAFQSIVRDVTERKQAEDDKHQLELQLRHSQKMEAVGTLAGGVAHDFNNLLQAVQGYAELLIIGKKEDDAELNALQAILRAAQKGSELTQQLLTFSRKVESKKQPVILNHTVNNTKSLLIRTIPKMIEIELDLANNLNTVNADPVQIELSLMNLAVNARDAMPEGGKLIIKTENVFLDANFCRTHLGLRPGDYVLLSVADNGSGIEKEILDHIFEPFFTSKEVGKGTGLGLAMIYGIVQNHQGHITCDSEPGEGTVFKLYLPCTKQKTTAPETKEDEGFLQGGRETILLVDDEESILDLGKQLLVNFGYKVLTAADGESALQQFREGSEQIDLVILDLIMPGMGGRKCLEGLIKKDPNVKVLIASGYTFNGTIKETVEAGAGGFINKPYDLHQMLKEIRGVLDKD